MGTFILRRLLQTIPVLFGVALIAFVLTEFSGSPVRQMLGSHVSAETLKRVEAHFGYDKPPLTRFVNSLTRLLTGDLGVSISKDGKPVATIVMEGLAVTIKVTLGAFFFAITIGIILGILSGWKPSSGLDYAASAFAALGISAPAFFLGMLLLMLFSVQLKLFPIGGYEGGSIIHLILPSLTLGLLSTATISRLTRNCLLDCMSADYIRSGRAKGQGEWHVLLGHAFPNALVPVVTVIGNDFAGLLVGAVLTETVFQIPGIGSVISDAIFQRDLPVVMGCCVVFAVIFVIINILVDVLYAYLDPRIRHAE